MKKSKRETKNARELVDVILPLDTPMNKLDYIKRIIEPCDLVSHRFTRMIDEETTYEAIGHFNYYALWFLEPNIFYREPTRGEKTKHQLEVKLNDIRLRLYLFKRKIKRLLVIICLMFTIAGCDLPVDVRANIEPNVDWDIMCYDCHNSENMGVNCVSGCLDCHDLAQHPGYISLNEGG